MTAASNIRACPCCGLVQQVAPVPAKHIARCARCRSIVIHARHPRALARAAAFSLSALILYPIAMVLPVISIESMGIENSATIWSGVVELMGDGQIAIGLLILVCSIVIPLVKIGGMFALCTGNALLSRSHRMLTYRTIDFIGRWGMIDVLLVAVLVAVVKLGNWMEVQPGPGAVAFGSVVLLSMLASASFDPALIWEERDA